MSICVTTLFLTHVEGGQLMVIVAERSLKGEEMEEKEGREGSMRSGRAGERRNRRQERLQERPVLV